MIDDEEGQTEFGFIAQEVKEVFPEVVKEIQQYELDENGEETTEEVNYIGVSYVQLIAPMVEAIKELKSQNETLEARIESLENN
jgi:ATP-dependent RNA circularization protein (DNA/RNA ligase family)